MGKSFADDLEEFCKKHDFYYSIDLDDPDEQIVLIPKSIAKQLRSKQKK